MWGTLLGSGAYIQGGKSGALEDSFSAVLEDHDCLDHGALAATGLPPKALSDYGFTLFPPMSGGTSPLLVSGDFMGQFTPNKNATALLKYLASPSAQSRWVGQSSAFGAYAFSDDQDQAVLGAYPKGVQQDIANLLRPDSHRELCFSAEDMMRPDVSAAFSQAVLDYVNDLGTPDHGAAFLTSLLQGLQTTQQAVGPSPVARKACARS
jgi:hypothetical protein